MIWILVAVGVMAGLALAIFCVGILRPRGHTVSRMQQFSAPPEEVWRLIADFAVYPTWRKELDRVELVSDEDGQPVWKEIAKRGDSLTLQRIECEPGRRLVHRIADVSLPFGGAWVFELKPVAGGSQ